MPYLLKDPTRRAPICPEERLVITLRYLAEGMSQQSLRFSLRYGRCTITKILQETCDALVKVLSPIDVRPPETCGT